MIDFESIVDYFRRRDCKALDDLVQQNLLLAEKNLIEFKKHPLGFYYYKLFDDSTNAVRLHLWIKNSLPQSPGLVIHNHDFDLESYVFLGKIKNTEYKIKIDEMGEGLSMYEVTYDSTHSILKEMNSRAGVISKVSKVINKGEFYSVNHPDFHESDIIDEEFAVTLAITSMIKKKVFPMVVSTRKMNEDVIYFEREKVKIKEDSHLILSKIINTIT